MKKPTSSLFEFPTAPYVGADRKLNHSSLGNTLGNSRELRKQRRRPLSKRHQLASKLFLATLFGKEPK